MALSYAYHYAAIKPDTNMCAGVQTTTAEMDPVEDHEFVEIPVYDPEYLFKYYIDGEWYEDPDATVPWQSALL